MRKKDENLREHLLACARELLAGEGPGALSIRAIAKSAGVATGTVYNYFSSKEDMLLALTEEYWQDTLSQLRQAVQCEDFPIQVEAIYHFLKGRITRSAGLLMASLRGAEQDGRQRMQQMQAVLQNYLAELLQKDPKVQSDIWDETFTKEAYLSFVRRNLVMLLGSGAPDIHFFSELIRRTIY